MKKQFYENISPLFKSRRKNNGTNITKQNFIVLYKKNSSQAQNKFQGVFLRVWITGSNNFKNYGIMFHRSRRIRFGSRTSDNKMARRLPWNWILRHGWEHQEWSDCFTLLGFWCYWELGSGNLQVRFCNIIFLNKEQTSAFIKQNVCHACKFTFLYYYSCYEIASMGWL